MSLRAPWKWLALASVAAAACSTATNKQDPGRPVGFPLQPATDTLVEQAHDGAYPVPAGKRTTVDANSDLVITFDPSGGELSPDDAAHLAHLQTVLDQAVAAGKERAEILAEFEALSSLPEDKRDADQKARLKLREADSVASARKLLAHLKELGFSQAEIGDAIDRTTDKQKKEGQGGFAALASLLQARQKAMLDRAKDVASTAKKLEVSVQAFIDSSGQDRRQLHVDNYDTLPAGEYAPIPRLSAQMTPAEKARFRRNMQESEAWASALRSLQEKSLRPSLRGLRDEFHALLKALPEDLAETLHEALANATLTPEVREALQKQLEEVLDAVQLARDARDAWKTVLPTDESSLDLLSALDRLKAAIGKTNAALKALPELGTKLSALVANPALPETLKNSLAAAGDASLNALVERMKARAPTITGLVAALEKVLGWLLQDEKVIDAKEVPPELWYLLTDAPEARVELARSGLTTGDSVLVKAVYRVQGTEKIQRATTYKVDAELMGWHRQISAELTFARADHGPGTAKDWKPGVAAVADLHYRYRDESSSWNAFWNFIDPAIGVHLATLDQTEDSAEMGMGVNLAFFDGFLTGGVGWNFSAESDDGLYYFVGIDLIDVLSAGKTSLVGTN